MLNLKLPFIWYDDVDKRSDHNELCYSTTCGYKLITPITNLLPFQIRTDNAFPGTSFGIVSWTIFCPDGTLYADLLLDLSILNVIPLDGYYYIYYEGATLLEAALPNLPITLHCGTYYSRIETEYSGEFFNYYSEFFTVVDFTEETDTEHITLFTPFRWYDNILKQNRYKENCLQDCGYCLITNNDSTLLPFQIRTEVVFEVGDITTLSWKIYCADGTFVTEVFPSVLAITVTEVDGVYYITYNGIPLLINPPGFPATNINLVCGSYYSVIDFYIVDDFEMVENGAMSSSVGWLIPIFPGTWSYDGVNDEFDHSTGNTLSLGNSLLTPLLSSSDYQLTFDIKNYVSGTLTAHVGGVGGTAGTPISGNGTYTERILTSSSVAANLYFTPSSNFVGSIDNVSLRRVEIASYYSEIFCVVNDINEVPNNYLMTDDSVPITTDDGLYITID